MVSFIARMTRGFFLLFLFFVLAPTFLFLTKWYYIHLVSKKTYVGVITIPNYIEKSDEVINSAKTLFSSGEIKGIIIKCNGVGGNIGSCQAIHEDLLRLKALYKKPLIAYCEKECFGGAYVIATAADTIVATEGCIIGNINQHFETQPSAENRSSLKQDHKRQYKDIILKCRTKVTSLFFSEVENNAIAGKNGFTHGLVDSLGGNLEVERLMRLKTVIEGSMEEVQGSLATHFVTSVLDIVNKLIRGIKLN